MTSRSEATELAGEHLDKIVGGNVSYTITNTKHDIVRYLVYADVRHPDGTVDRYRVSVSNSSVNGSKKIASDVDS
ncbi:hypothetical protein [Haloglomus halophilum]|uniref:hypothetical protein n=1 Tax=Haloglomus halophilum TaxID=2962672 RepID=UPI0020C9E8CA|nr:hypothetical protein [Haloglomus halophilum]